MLRHFIILIILLGISFDSKAQAIEGAEELPIGLFKFDLAIPDLPAFKALDTDPSNILRPSTTERLSAVLSEFYSGDEFIVPESFAAEFTPFLMFPNNKVTLKNYRENHVLYSLRTSIGTLRDSTNVSKTALGLRITPINKRDARKDTSNFLMPIASILTAQAEEISKYLDEYQVINNLTEEQLADSVNLEAARAYANEQIIRDYQTLISDVERRYEEMYWNAEKLDISMAVVFTSQDTLAKNLNFESFSAWATYARPLKSNGQVLIGGNLKIVDGKKELFEQLQEDKVFYEASLGSRIYVGSNETKVFAEAQYTYRDLDDEGSFLLNFGSEFSPGGGVWLDFTMGVMTNTLNNRTEFVTSANVRIKLSDRIRLL